MSLLRPRRGSDDRDMSSLLASPTDTCSTHDHTLDETVVTTFLAAARALDDDLPPFWD